MNQELDARQSLSADERETTLTMSDGDDFVRINTAQRAVLTRLRKKPEIFTEIRSGFFGTTEWAEFTCPRQRFNLAAAARPKRELSEAQREVAKANMARLHASKHTQNNPSL